MEAYSHGASPPQGLIQDLRARLQTLLDQKEQELQSAGSLGQRILAQQMELEERMNQISEFGFGRTSLKDNDEIESEVRARQNDLADTVQAWHRENQQLLRVFGPKVGVRDFNIDLKPSLRLGNVPVARRQTPH